MVFWRISRRFSEFNSHFRPVNRILPKESFPGVRKRLRLTPIPICWRGRFDYFGNLEISLTNRAPPYMRQAIQTSSTFFGDILAIDPHTSGLDEVNALSIFWRAVESFFTIPPDGGRSSGIPPYLSVCKILVAL